MRRFAVLGATGCVGRQVCRALVRRGDHVLAVTRRPADHVPASEFRTVDLGAEPPERIAAMLIDSQVDVVVNATGGWGTTEEEMLHAHVRLVERLVEAMTVVPSRPRLVHCGTIHEYGAVAEGTLIGEDIEPTPQTPYARTKLAGSETILRAARANRVDGVVLRTVNVCGPYPAPASFPGVLLNRLRAAAVDATVVEFTVAGAMRDYIDVRDMAEAVLLAADKAATGQVINIGRGKAVAMGDFVRMFVAAAGFPPDRVRLRSEQVASKGGDWTCADIGLARTLLDWEPRISLPDSLSAMWEAKST